jgi:hypothetical protein
VSSPCPAPPTHTQAVAYEYSTEFGPVLAQRMAFFCSDPAADTINRVKGEILQVGDWVAWTGGKVVCVGVGGCVVCVWGGVSCQQGDVAGGGASVLSQGRPLCRRGIGPAPLSACCPKMSTSRSAPLPLVHPPPLLLLR